MKIKKTLVLVEMENGDVHQVLATPEQKEISIILMKDERGVLLLSERVEPVTLEPLKENSGITLTKENNGI